MYGKLSVTKLKYLIDVLQHLRYRGPSTCDISLTGRYTQTRRKGPGQCVHVRLTRKARRANLVLRRRGFQQVINYHIFHVFQIVITTTCEVTRGKLLSSMSILLLTCLCLAVFYMD